MKFLIQSLLLLSVLSSFAIAPAFAQQSDTSFSTDQDFLQFVKEEEKKLAQEQRDLDRIVNALDSAKENESTGHFIVVVGEGTMGTAALGSTLGTAFNLIFSSTTPVAVVFKVGAVVLATGAVIYAGGQYILSISKKEMDSYQIKKVTARKSIEVRKLRINNLERKIRH